MYPVRRITDDPLGRLLITVNIIGVMAASLFVIFWAAEFFALGWAGYDFTQPTRVLMVGLATTVIVVDMLFIVGRLFSNRESHLKAKTEDGEVLIAVGAIEDSLARTARSLPEVNDARVRVYKEKGEGKPITIIVNYAAWEDTNVREVTHKVQQACAMRFEQIAGSDANPTFSIFLSRITVKDDRSKAAAAKRRSADEPSDAFRGPVYPTDEF